MNDRTESGFTLLELIVTITILGLLVTGIFNLYLSVESAQRKSHYLEIATRAGEKQIESMRNTQYSNLLPGVDLSFTADLPDDLPSPKSGVVIVSEPEDGIRRVDVRVTFKDGNGSRTVRQSSLIGVLGITQ